MHVQDVTDDCHIDCMCNMLLMTAILNCMCKMLLMTDILTACARCYWWLPYWLHVQYVTDDCHIDCICNMLLMTAILTAYARCYLSLAYWWLAYWWLAYPVMTGHALIYTTLLGRGRKYSAILLYWYLKLVIWWMKM